MGNSTLMRYWHRFWRNYNEMLIDGCLDDKLRKELNHKVEYHEIKLSA